MLEDGHQSRMPTSMVHQFFPGILILWYFINPRGWWNPLTLSNFCCTGACPQTNILASTINWVSLCFPWNWNFLIPEVAKTFQFTVTCLLPCGFACLKGVGWFAPMRAGLSFVKTFLYSDSVSITRGILWAWPFTGYLRFLFICFFESQRLLKPFTLYNFGFARPAPM